MAHSEFLAQLKVLEKNRTPSSLTDSLVVELQTRYKNSSVFLVDDESLFSKFYQQHFSVAGICYKSLTINELLKIPEQLSSGESVLFLPVFECRILNINFERIKKKELGSPYLVFAEDNRASIVKNKLQMKFSEVVTNPLMQLPHFLKAYLQSKELLHWLESPELRTPHNDAFDRKLVVKHMSSKFKFLIPKYSKSKQLGEQDLLSYLIDHLELRNEAIFYRHYPAHIIYKKFLNKNLSINLLEQELYGTVG
jgi:hypothetical protein